MLQNSIDHILAKHQQESIKAKEPHYPYRMTSINIIYIINKKTLIYIQSINTILFLKQILLASYDTSRYIQFPLL